ncbi:MAG: hypothetical protein GF418_16195 [Chitinivibrionales bacterium]|nr:hypothetical protein [Chitinivibrionales bacterium]MBD3397162.1 hypothetical protein [Chitinivibrionales bacterium]
MDLPTILVKIAGAILLGWTIFSIAKHIRQKRAARGQHESQSVVEQILNNILLYLWLAFMLAFSSGMILNN